MSNFSKEFSQGLNLSDYIIPDKNLSHSDQSAIKFDGVSFSYDGYQDALSDVSFELETGSVTFLTGPSGAGKTTLLKLMHLSIKPQSGRICFFGTPHLQVTGNQLAYYRRRTGLVFQDFKLLAHLNVYENIALPLQITGEKDRNYRDDVVDLINWIGLEGRLNAFPHQLSGGEQQRVAIARAVVGKPDLLIADEPTGNVDPEMGQRLMRLFMELNRRIGATLFIATHDLSAIDGVEANILKIDSGLVMSENLARANDIDFEASPAPKQGDNK